MRKGSWLLVGMAALTGCNSQDADCLGKLGGRLGEGARVLVGDSHQRLCAQVPACRGDGTIEERVSRRLKWDKALAEQPIQVKAVENGVELRGQVTGEELRRRAIELAETTVGIEQVRDLLEVATHRLPDEAGSTQ